VWFVLVVGGRAENEGPNFQADPPGHDWDQQLEGGKKRTVLTGYDVPHRSRSVLPTTSLAIPQGPASEHAPSPPGKNVFSNFAGAIGSPAGGWNRIAAGSEDYINLLPRRARNIGLEVWQGGIAQAEKKKRFCQKGLSLVFCRNPTDFANPGPESLFQPDHFRDGLALIEAR